MKEFQIQESSMCSVTVRTEYAPKIETPKQLFEVLKGENTWVSISSEDHPEFAELRETLGRLGIIKIETRWWNGDRVLQPFKLNGMIFKKDETFPCAAAIQFNLESKRRWNTNK
jgi:hypothetical protein